MALMQLEVRCCSQNLVDFPSPTSLTVTQAVTPMEAHDVAVAIAEQDSLHPQQPMVVWSWPVTSPLQDYLHVSRSDWKTPSALVARVSTPASFQYLAVSVSRRPSILSVSLALYSPELNPPKLTALARLLLQIYEESNGSAPTLLSALLRLLSRGTVKTALGVFGVSSYPSTHIPPVSGLISRLAERSLLLWIAVMLRKRIFVVAKSSELVQVIMSIAALAAHRKQYEICHPFLEIDKSTEHEQVELRGKGQCIAGFTSEKTSRLEEHWDVLVHCMRLFISIVLII